jgi:hypothetical protein
LFSVDSFDRRFVENLESPLNMNEIEEYRKQGEVSVYPMSGKYEDKDFALDCNDQVIDIDAFWTAIVDVVE